MNVPRFVHTVCLAIDLTLLVIVAWQAWQLLRVLAS